MNGPLYMKNPTIEIELSNTNEYVATIDEADYDLVSPYNWRYARRTSSVNTK